MIIIIFLKFLNNNEKENNKSEFGISPKKHLEPIKEEEELKLKKESTKEIMENKTNLLTILENDSEQEKNSVKDEHINFGNINNNEIKQKNEYNNENYLSSYNNKIKQKSEQSNDELLSSIEEEEKKENESSNIILNKIENEENKNDEINLYNNNDINNMEQNIDNIRFNIDNEHDLINIEDLLNGTSNEEELNKIVEENGNHLDDLLNNYNINLINNIMDVDINIFKNNVNEFIAYSKQKINKLQLLDDISDKIKEKIIINYNLMATKKENNINEYNILLDYEKKLDYIISMQNTIINNLESINTELNKNIDLTTQNIDKSEIKENEYNNNINETNNNIQKMDNIISDYFINNNNIYNLNNINIKDLNENDNFFEVLKSIYEPIKEINKAYEHIMLECVFSKND